MLSDLKFAFRCLLTAPAFAAVVILTLALGVGATTAVFSVVRAVLIKPLPYPNPDQLVLLSESSEQVPSMSVSYPNFQDWRERQQTFTAMGAFQLQTLNYVGAQGSERVAGALLSHDIWTTLAQPPQLGRIFSEAEDRPGGERVAVISDAFWRRNFAARPDVLGSRIRLSGQLYSIIGVMPGGFDFPMPSTQVWTSLGQIADAPGYASRDNHPGLYVVARLKPQVSFASAQANMLTIARQLAAEYPASNGANSVSMLPVSEVVVGKLRRALWLLWFAATFVLLVACANIGNLILARGLARQRELAVRAAVGASHAQLVRQLLIENLVLGVLGSLAGVLIAGWSFDVIGALLPADLPGVGRLTLSPGVLAFGIAAGTVTMLLFGLAPAVSASRTDPARALSSGAAGAVGGHSRWRNGLLIGELALTVVLMAGAGLMIRTLQNVHGADLGFTTGKLLTFNWNMMDSAYEQDSARLRVLGDALTKLAALPGVTYAAFINPLPLSGSTNQTVFNVEGTAAAGAGNEPFTEIAQISPDAFRALDIPLVSGRAFTAADQGDAANVVIIDSTLARTYFPERDPIGQRLKLGPAGSDAAWLEIVGVVGHIQNRALGQETRYQVYVPYTAAVPLFTTFVLRTAGEPTLLHAPVRRVLREVEPALPLFDLKTMDDVFSATVSSQRLTLKLLSGFATLALLLAAVGLYGAFSYSVGQRVRELGVRMAIGATPAALRALILTQGLRLAVTGLALGLVGAIALNRLLSALLYEASPQDPVVLAAVVLVLLLVCVVACWLPAQRAARVDPLVALRVG